ncbi:MAG: SOS response-associated peptidase family protein [Erythrobacter sp.]
MCNLYRMTKAKAEIAHWFDAIEALGGANFGDEVYPGYPGAVVAQGKVQQMNWGFPLVMKGKNGQALKPKPVNNARTDKLDSGFWRQSFMQRRCLIPISAWAEAQGQKGAMTRTWLSLPDDSLFACAGIWRSCDEWGDCYSMVMTGSTGSAAQEIHSRMPVLLRPEDYTRWIRGAPDEALELCRAWPGDLQINRTEEGWVRGSAPPAQSQLF